MTGTELFTLLAAIFGAFGVPTGVIVWAIRLEGRQGAHERECLVVRQAIRLELALLRGQSDERHTENREWLQSLDGKLDRLLDR